MLKAGVKISPGREKEISEILQEISVMPEQVIKNNRENHTDQKYI